MEEGPGVTRNQSSDDLMQIEEGMAVGKELPIQETAAAAVAATPMSNLLVVSEREQGADRQPQAAAST